MLEFARQDGFVVIAGGADGRDLPIRQIIGVGKNYSDHAREMGGEAPLRPMLFAKAITSLILDGEPIVIPRVCQDREQVDYEGELGVIIGRAARNVTEDAALRHVLGYTIANDVSARWWQKEGSGGQFHLGKSFDGFCPVGPRVTPAAELGDPQALRLRALVNGETRQDASTGEMIFSVATLIAHISQGRTLVPGTLILTGTPSGVGAGRDPKVFLRDGDEVVIEIEGVGTLRNPVLAEG